MEAIAALAAVIFALVRGAVQWRGRAGRDRRWWLGWLPPLIALVVAGWCAATDLPTQKVLAKLVLPVGLLWLGLAGLTVWLWWRRQAGPALAAGALFLGLTVAGNHWVGDGLLAWLEARAQPLAPEAVPPLDAVCVLGGGTDVDADGRAQLGKSGDRLAAAAAAWHAGRARVLVASGITITGLYQPRRFDEESAQIWARMGIPAAAIRGIPRGRITREEVAEYAALARAEGWTRIGLVTSAWHLPRALRLCRAAGLEVVPILADARGATLPWSPVWLVPGDSGLESTRLACWELGGMLIGR